MRAAAYTLALTVVLALTSLLARCQHDQASTENEAEPLCKDFPSYSYITVSEYDLDQNELLVYHSQESDLNKLSVVYGTALVVLCHGTNPENLAIMRNDVKLITEESSFDISWFTDKLDLQQNVFTCIDSKTACELSVIILVTPRLEVTSPMIGNCLLRDYIYTVQYGNLTVLCSGPDGARLVMSKVGKTLPTKRKNYTTIESFERTPDLQTSDYVCTDVDTTYNGSVIVKIVPKIYFQSRNIIITPYMYPYCDNAMHYHLEYTDLVEVFCSGPRAVKFIHREYNTTGLKDIIRHDFLETLLGKNTVLMNITKLGKSEYTCSDNEFPDYAQSVIVIVGPRIEVASPSSRKKEILPLQDKYFIIPYREPLEIVCSGPDSSRLSIRMYSTYIVGDITDSVEQTVNKSAVKFTVKEPAWVGFKLFLCKEVERNKGIRNKGWNWKDIYAEVRVAVLPAAKDFRCVSYNQQYVNCTWTATNDEILYTLSHDRNGTLHPICERESQYNKKLLFCLWEYMIVYSSGVSVTFVRDFTFKMQSRNNIGSTNQTFHFDHLTTILKTAPPEKLKVVKKTSRGAVLEWQCAELRLSCHSYYQYKVQYWHYGIGSQDGNSSLVTCDRNECQIELNLRCPGQFYEVWIYQKLKTTIGEEFWSDPSYVSLKTDEENDNTNNLDPKCKEPVKKEVMQYLVQELRKEMRPEIQPMKQKVRALYDKLANIRKYIASTKEQDRI